MVSPEFDREAGLIMACFCKPLCSRLGNSDSTPAPQASIAEYPSVLRSNLPISNDETIVCGMALGYADQDSEINFYQPERLDINDFTTFLD